MRAKQPFAQARTQLEVRRTSRRRSTRSSGPGIAPDPRRVNTYGEAAEPTDLDSATVGRTRRDVFEHLVHRRCDVAIDEFGLRLRRRRSVNFDIVIAPVSHSPREDVLGSTMVRASSPEAVNTWRLVRDGCTARRTLRRMVVQSRMMAWTDTPAAAVYCPIRHAPLRGTLRAGNDRVFGGGTVIEAICRTRTVARKALDREHAAHRRLCWRLALSGCSEPALAGPSPFRPGSLAVSASRHVACPLADCVQCLRHGRLRLPRASPALLYTAYRDRTGGPTLLRELSSCLFAFACALCPGIASAQSPARFAARQLRAELTTYVAIGHLRRTPRPAHHAAASLPGPCELGAVRTAPFS